MGVPAEKVERALYAARLELSYAEEHATQETAPVLRGLVAQLDLLIDAGAR